MPSILILGGTTEARQLAEALAPRADLAITLSLAGRTAAPPRFPVPVRSGGFGGADGLAAWLRDHAIDLMVDATHPFAARISAHAEAAARVAGVEAFALRRPPWSRGPGDRWMEVADIPAAIAALGPIPRRVLLALGRQEAHAAELAPQHRYLVRSVEPVEPPLRLPHMRAVLARGPFTLEGDLALLRDERIDAIVCKNSGGGGAYAKIAAARALGIAVMIVQPPPPSRLPQVGGVAEAIVRIDHRLAPGALRGA